MSDALKKTPILNLNNFFNSCPFTMIQIRTIFAVYEMVGSEADQSKAEELFNRLDLNSDGSISQVGISVNYKIREAFKKKV